MSPAHRLLAVTAVIALAATKAPACSTSAPCPTSEVCRSGQCEALTFVPHITPRASVPGETAAPFTMLFITDLQFVYAKCKDEPLSSCIFDKKSYNVSNGRVAKAAALSAAAEGQFACLGALKNRHAPVAVLDAGDLTNHGAVSELRKIEDYHARVRDEIAPLVFNLGNHDYSYDGATNRRYSDENVLRMLDYYVRYIPTVPNFLAADFEVAPAVADDARPTGIRYRGSMVYAVEHGAYVLFMLHWSAALRTGTFLRAIEGTDPGTSKYRFYDITDGRAWLAAEAARAHARGKKIVLVPHSQRALRKYLAKPPVGETAYTTMGDRLGALDVVAVLSGHDHDAWGKQPTQLALGSAKSVDVVYGGSLSYRTMVLLEFGATGSITSTPYDTRNGAGCEETTPNDEN